MAHSRIIEVSTDPLDRSKWAVADDFIKNGFVGFVADYTSDLNEAERLDSIACFGECIKDAYGIVQEGSYHKLIPLPQGKVKYFTNRLDALVTLVNNISIEEFCQSHAVWQIEELLRQKQSFYVCENGEYQTLDTFIRDCCYEGEEYYICAVIDYHM